jgi:hypothetical protein
MNSYLETRAVQRTERSGISQHCVCGLGPEEQIMKTLLCALIAIAIATPALAQLLPTGQFFIVRDNRSKQCFVTDTRPSSSNVTIVGDGTIYRRLADAQAALPTVKACNGQ